MPWSATHVPRLMSATRCASAWMYSWGIRAVAMIGSLRMPLRDVDRARDLVDGVHVADLPAGDGLDHLGAVPDGVLLRREPVAMDDRPLDLSHDALVGHGRRSAPVGQQLLVGHLEHLEVVPPGRLVLAPMPVEQLRQQPGRLLLRVRSSAAGRPAVEPLDERLDRGLLLRQVGRWRGLLRAPAAARPCPVRSRPRAAPPASRAARGWRRSRPGCRPR